MTVRSFRARRLRSGKLDASTDAPSALAARAFALLAPHQRFCSASARVSWLHCRYSMLSFSAPIYVIDLRRVHCCDTMLAELWVFSLL
jgi:hypothetical protein